MSKGLILPIKPDGTPYSSSSSASSLLNVSNDTISTLWKSSNPKPRPGEVRLFYAQGENKDLTLALVGTGKVGQLNENELLERSRTVAAVGVKALRDVGCTDVSEAHFCKHTCADWCSTLGKYS